MPSNQEKSQTRKKKFFDELSKNNCIIIHKLIEICKEKLKKDNKNPFFRKEKQII